MEDALCVQDKIRKEGAFAMKLRLTDPVQGGKRKLLPLAVLLLLLVIAAVWFLAHNAASPNDADLMPHNFDVSIDGNASEGNIPEGKEDIQSELNRQVEEGMIRISMNIHPVFETGSGEGNLLIINDETNRHMQIVEIYRDDTGDLIYRSGGIPVGSSIESAKLDVRLSKGIYPCMAYFNAVDDSTGALLGKAGAKIEITVNQ